MNRLTRYVSTFREVMSYGTKAEKRLLIVLSGIGVWAFASALSCAIFNFDPIAAFLKVATPIVSDLVARILSLF